MKEIVPSLLLMFCLSGCNDRKQEAGLEGSNPVVGLKYVQLGHDPYFEVTLSVNDTGKVIFSGKATDRAISTHVRQVVPTEFTKIAADLRSWRVPAGHESNFAQCRSPIRDVPSDGIVWVYRNGQEARYFSDGCMDAASRRFYRAIKSLEEGLGADKWIKDFHSQL